MNKLNFKNLRRKNEIFLLITIIIFAFIIQLRSGQFFTGNNIVDLSRSMIVLGLFAIGTQIIMISGGIDVSFTAIAATVGYVVPYYLVKINYDGHMILVYLFGAFLGILMGFINGIIISRYNFNTLIVTLGTMSIFLGILFGLLNAIPMDVPPAMLRHGRTVLFTAFNKELGISSNMPITIFILIGVLIITFLIMHYTMLGRGIYAIGGDETSARQAGFNVFSIKLFVYCYAGLLAGIAGIVRSSLMLGTYPSNLVGLEMVVIAAVVLGGTRLNGGMGTLTGMMLGVALITMLSNSLILLGVPTYWQRAFTGLIIIIGTGISYNSDKRFKIKTFSKHLVSTKQGDL